MFVPNLRLRLSGAILLALSNSIQAQSTPLIIDSIDEELSLEALVNLPLIDKVLSEAD